MKDRSTTYIRRSYQPRVLSNLSFYTPRKIMNRINAERGFRARETVTSGMPYYLTVEPTNFCNLRCPLCFASLKEGYRKRGYMEWDTYVKVLDFFGPYLLKLQLYNQGEPLLHEGIYSR